MMHMYMTSVREKHLLECSHVVLRSENNYYLKFITVRCKSADLFDSQRPLSPTADSQ